MSDLLNRVALVTGASRGIGRAIALALAEAGAAIAVNYRERSTDAEAIADAIRQKGRRAETFRADVSSSNAVNGMVADVVKRFGPIEILVNNAGVAAARDREITEADFDHIIAANLKSAFLCTEAVLPPMRARRWGRIVNISAVGARIGSSNVAYGASKAGLEGMTRSYALRLASEGVTVNTVAPGLIDTEMSKPLIEAGSGVARIPVGRAGTVEEIAEAVLFVSSNSYMTGQTISVNGGVFFS